MPPAPHYPADASAPDSGADGAGSSAALARIEARLERLERQLGLPPLPATAAAAPVPGPAERPAAAMSPAGGPLATPADALAAGPEIESEIGEFLLARVGVVALIAGLAFLVVYPFAGWPALLPSLLGYAAVAGLLGLARMWRRALPDTARILAGGALVLLYFATLRLHFFSPAPALGSRAVALGCVGVVLAVHFAIAVRRRSEFTAALATVLVLATAVVADRPGLALVLLAVAAGVTVEFYRRFHWWRLQLAAVGLVYAAHLHWLLGNPLAGHPLRGVTDPQGNLFFLLLEGAVFGAAGLLRPQEEEPGALRVLRAMLTAGGLFVLGLLNQRQFHLGQPPWIPLGLALGFLALATAYWQHHRGRYGTAIYACFGYLALSVAILAWFPSPAVYGWLAWQSLLVAATAVWFRSKIVIVANLFICGGIFFAYLLLAPASGTVSLSFALVALAIARILNWRKEHLSLRTEFMRNTYLAAATVIIPYGLYHLVPRLLVSTSWLLAAAGYFGASLLLANRKYRWMAIATIFATIGYVFVVDLSRLEPAYRILSFLVLGVGLIALSIFYARQRKKQQAPSAGAPASP